MRETHRLRAKGYVNAVAWNADGSRLAVLSNYGSHVTVWESEGWSVLKEYDHLPGIIGGTGYSQNSFAYLPDGSFLSTAPFLIPPPGVPPIHPIFALVQWNAETGELIRYFPDVADPAKMPVKIFPSPTFAVSPAGDLVAGQNGSNVALYDGRSGTFLRELTVPAEPPRRDFAHSLAFSPDGKQLGVGTIGGNVHIFAPNDGAPRLSFKAFEDKHRICGALAFNSDSHLLATGRGLVGLDESDNGWVRIWKTDNGALTARITGAGGTVRKLSWDPKGDLLAVGGDGGLTLWETSESSDSTRLARKFSDDVYSLSFCPPGRLAASDRGEIAIYE